MADTTNKELFRAETGVEPDVETPKKAVTATRESKALSEEGQDTIQVGKVYKEENGIREVIPYFVDFNAATVNFADVARSNEDKMRTSDFLNRFKLQGESTLTNEVIPKEETESFKAVMEADPDKLQGREREQAILAKPVATEKE